MPFLKNVLETSVPCERGTGRVGGRGGVTLSRQEVAMPKVRPRLRTRFDVRKPNAHGFRRLSVCSSSNVLNGERFRFGSNSRLVSFGVGLKKTADNANSSPAASIVR